MEANIMVLATVVAATQHNTTHMPRTREHKEALYVINAAQEDILLTQKGEEVSQE
jgi:hypothetical protein